MTGYPRRVGARVFLPLLFVAACGGPARVRAPAPLVAEPPVERLLVASCYPCHASGASVPWLGRIAPSSWPSSARTVLDFAQWGTYDAARRAAALNAIAASVDGGSMPPIDFTLLHHAAKLTAAERHQLASWAAAEAASIPTP